MQIDNIKLQIFFEYDILFMVIFMKKNIVIFIVIAIVITASIGLIYASTILHGKEKYEDKHLIEITFKELQEKVDNKETFILLISRSDCSHCIEYKPTLKKVLAENDIIAYEIQLDKISAEDEGKLKDIANVSGTPNTIFIENGVEKSTSQRLSGAVSESKLRSRLKALGYTE